MLDAFTPDLPRAAADATGAPLLLAQLLLPALAVLGGLALGRLAELLLVGTLPMLTRRTRSRVDDLLAESLKGPLTVFGGLAGLGVALLLLPLPEAAHAWTRRLMAILLGVLVIVLGARFLGGLVGTYGERAHLEGPMRGLARRVAVLLVWAVGLLVVLDHQGISITPLLTTLGIAGLAVALAFQDTLGNLFAGAYIQADRPLEAGHYVRLEDHGVEGYVVDVGWRTTKIRTLANNLVVIPNSRVASSVVTDYDLPVPRMSLLVRVPVGHGADHARVTELLVDEAKAAAKEVDGLLAEPEPFVRFIPGFTEWGLEFTLIVQVRSFVDQYLAQDQLRRRIEARLRAEGIPLSTPHRTVRVEGAALPVATAPASP